MAYIPSLALRCGWGALNRPRRGRQGSAPWGRAAEATINVSMAEVLDGMRHAWRARGERMGRVLRGGRRPDILVTRDGRAPVIIETEFMPANTLEADVLERVDAETTTEQRVGGVVGVRVPDRFKQLDGGQIRDELRSSADLEYATWSPDRFPERGWITGGLADIAEAAEAVSVPRMAVDDCVDDMSDAVDAIAEIIGGGGAHKNAEGNCPPVVPKGKRADLENGRPHPVQRIRVPQPHCGRTRNT